MARSRERAFAAQRDSKPELSGAGSQSPAPLPQNVVARHGSHRPNRDIDWPQGR
jgi:hypothetical protein